MTGPGQCGAGVALLVTSGAVWFALARAGAFLPDFSGCVTLPVRSSAFISVPSLMSPTSDQKPGSPSPRPSGKDSSRPGRKGPDRQKTNWSTLALFGVAIAVVISAFFFNQQQTHPEDLNLDQFQAKLQAGEFENSTISLRETAQGDTQIVGSYLRDANGQPIPENKPPRRFATNYDPEIQGDQLKGILATAQLTPKVTRERPSPWTPILVSYLPMLLIIGLLIYFFSRQMKNAGRGAMSFGKSRAKLLQQEKGKVTFADVAGVQEAKEEVTEIVDFLKDPQRFQKLGGSIPKGVLLVGPPGTGKTLLARAIAGEADVPFFSISGSDFVEMFVGVGASRVRDMFEQARNQAPCLVFIDEIDAVGRHRGHGLGGGHDEREQTLNQLLVEMDGFDSQEGVIIIAATNRPDVLDPALLRPGRFDRQVTVSLPDVKGREQILRVHARKVKLSPEVDLTKIARGTPGFSGAELANLTNEAALLAARKGLEHITQAELEEARDKVRWGRERRSLALSEKEKRVTAVHEAGHAITLEILENTEPLHKVTIIPRGPSLGSTMWLPAEDKYNTRRDELLDSLVVAMGGRVAEEIVFGDVTSGASGDIRQATSIARRMVCEWGMSDTLGMVEYGDGEGGEVFLARDISRGRNYSEATAQKIDQEVKRLIDTAYDRARTILKRNRRLLDVLTEALLEHETLDADHVRQIMNFGELRTPPEPPRPPTPPAPPETVPPRPPKAQEEKDDGTLTGEVVGSPA